MCVVWEVFTIGVSYVVNCGRVDVRGDGVILIDIVYVLMGFEYVILFGVYYGLMKLICWYGVDFVVELWYSYCL